MVAEKIYKLPIADISRIRITCNKCKISSEAVSPKELAGFMVQGMCPHCQALLYETQSGRADPMTQLATALERLGELQTATVEFVISDPESKPEKTF
jgi:hypothetical protein